MTSHIVLSATCGDPTAADSALAPNATAATATSTGSSGKPASALQHAIDGFNGVNIVEAAVLEFVATPPLFRRVLSAQLQAWADAGRRGVWLPLPLRAAALVPVAVDLGFTYHHADAERVMLTVWLPELKHLYRAPAPAAAAAASDAKTAATTAAIATASATTAVATATTTTAPAAVAADPNKLPGYATAYLGVGGLVINSRREVLTVTEVYTRRKGFWKLPGGAVDAGESLPAAAVREVAEETAIAASFVSMIGFRHLYKFRFGCADMYFICLCVPCDDRASPTPQAGEIAEAKYMPLDEWFELPSVAWMKPWEHIVRAEVDRIYPSKTAATTATATTATAAAAAADSKTNAICSALLPRAMKTVNNADCIGWFPSVANPSLMPSNDIYHPKGPYTPAAIAAPAPTVAVAAAAAGASPPHSAL